MNKVYDRVKWRFLQFMIEKVGFADCWINQVMECVCTISFSMGVEGQPHGFLKPNRGFRQGDPLSPYLFLICAKGFSFLLHKPERNRKIQDVKISSGCPSISHLLFADNLLFCKASAIYCDNILEVLKSYERYSGQAINLSKLAMFFSKNTPHSGLNWLKGQISPMLVLGTTILDSHPLFIN